MMVSEKDNKYLENVALMDAEGTVYTYRELNHLSRIFGSKVSRDIILIFCNNSIGCYAGYYFSLTNKVVPLLIDYKLDRTMKEQIISLYRPRYIWQDTSNTEHYEHYEEILQLLDFVLYENKTNTNLLFEELALLLTTSGSTGSSKYVRISYKNLCAATAIGNKVININEKDRMISNLPLFYALGVIITQLHWSRGASVLVSRHDIMSTEFWYVFEEYKVTGLTGVPYLYEVLDKIDFLNESYENLRYMCIAGGKANKEILNKFLRELSKKGIPLWMCYGQTETAGFVSATRANSTGTIGKEIDGIEMKIVASDGMQLNHANVEGELVCEGECVSLGYAENGEDLSRADDNSGRIMTGDMGYFDEQGRFYLTGRKKRFVKIMGKRVSLDEMEILIKKKCDISDCACTGVDDEVNIFLCNERRVVEVKKFLVHSLFINKCYCTFDIVDKIPRLPSGKVDYATLNNMVHNRPK